MKNRFRVMLALTLMICLCAAAAAAGTWTVPSNNGSSGNSSSGYGGYTTTARLIEDLATRSGPSTTYTGCGSYRMKGQTVTVLSRAFDNGGVQWVEVEFMYNGGYRRAWTGVKRISISSSALSRLPEDNGASFLGYGTVTGRVSPRFGPSSMHAPYGDRDYVSGNQVAVIREENGYYLTESWITDSDGRDRILRSWLPAGMVNVY